MSLDAYQLLIQNLPVTEQCFTTKRETWQYAEQEFTWLRILNDQLFGDNDTLQLSRYELLKQQRPLRELIIATIYWGYPNGKRGHNFLNILRNIEAIEAALQAIKQIEAPTTKDYNALIKKLGCIRGLGISTYSKILYFMGIYINGNPCQILDLRLMDVFRSGIFPEFEELKSILYRTAPNHYLNYLSIINYQAKRLQTNSENIEQFLFIFGKNLKTPEQKQESTNGTMFCDGYCPECNLEDISINLSLNMDDLWECQRCYLQLAANPVQAIILIRRGIGRIYIDTALGSENINGAILTRAKGDTTESDKTTFNSEDELKAYLIDEVEPPLKLSLKNLLDTYAKHKYGNPFTNENSPLPYQRKSKYFKIDFDKKSILKKLEKRDTTENKDQYRSYKHLHRLLMSLFKKHYDANVDLLPEMGMSQSEVDLCNKHLHLIPEPVTESSSPAYKRQVLMALMVDLTKIIYQGEEIETKKFEFH